MARVDRGASTVVGYVLNLGIATLLIAGLLVSGASLVDTQRERVTRAELDVIGNRIAADLETADRLLRTGNSTVTVRSSLPETISGNQYRIEVRATDGSVEIVLDEFESGIVRTVPVGNVSSVETTSLVGGDVEIEGSDHTLEVTDG